MSYILRICTPFLYNFTSLKSLHTHTKYTRIWFLNTRQIQSKLPSPQSLFFSCLLCTQCSSHIYLLNPCLPISWFSGLYPNYSLFLELSTSKTSLSKPIYSIKSNIKLSSSIKYSKISPVKNWFPKKKKMISLLTTSIALYASILALIGVL